MSADDDPVTVLSEDESWSLLSSMSLGRLVTSLGGQPEIFPVNFVTQRPTVLFRTAEGTKLFSAVMNNQVAFEADDSGALREVENRLNNRPRKVLGWRTPADVFHAAVAT
jgi:nitroimidazol reductase NimA-like FMN-containing flavoprotein (pyridoxamine 5'-phosphate oxidase superfamily)